MTLHIITGGRGSGKSEKAKRLLSEAVDQDKSTFTTRSLETAAQALASNFAEVIIVELPAGVDVRLYDTIASPVQLVEPRGASDPSVVAARLREQLDAAEEGRLARRQEAETSVAVGWSIPEETPTPSITEWAHVNAARALAARLEAQVEAEFGVGVGHMAAPEGPDHGVEDSKLNRDVIDILSDTPLFYGNSESGWDLDAR